jgi:hypothetical protein
VEKIVSYIAKNPDSYKGKVVGEGHYKGQCAVFVQVAAGAPLTSSWKQGVQVKGNTVAKGTAIACFGTDGKYTNRMDGSAHAAIYISQDKSGIDVWDQWVGQPVHMRSIAFQNGAKGVKHVNDGDYFYVID